MRYSMQPDISLLVTYIPTILLLAFFISSVFLQIFLSKRKAQWQGLLLPIMFFVAVALSTLSGDASTEVFGWHFGVNIIYTMLVGNIPTAVMLIIYFVCRDKLKKMTSLNKMNIQDLE